VEAIAAGYNNEVSRRFPPPWSIDELEACFVVRDHSGQALAYVYFEDEPGRRSAAKHDNSAHRSNVRFWG
jgi:hypothetical protein